MKEIYTVGHSSHDNIYFLELLKKYNINCIIDIRSVPFSKYVPHFNKNVIKKFLNINGIYCIYMAEEFGAIRTNIDLFHPNGYLDFNKVKELKSFSEGLERLKDGIKKGYKICIMCTEKDPIDCHRSIMIAPELIKNNYSVIHIMPDGSTQTQQQLEDRLLRMYNLNLTQQDIFSFKKQLEDKNNLIERALKLRNADIGYKIKKTENRITP
ncbi:DUF488 family protein [Clostridium sp. DJ247]|uniref:DUF488 domain-containing protein n=1 Tax=Clostridium sp. DJ247 TaxID=2726188 RepID=UPI0016247917|nr:DUF488 domain-containing protein [Clostridium sp. DJ247]MBC2579542.1 DUF488 domain-containing protein [Clostridium sp. DJ247]